MEDLDYSESSDASLRIYYKNFGSLPEPELKKKNPGLHREMKKREMSFGPEPRPYIHDTGFMNFDDLPTMEIDIQKDEPQVPEPIVDEKELYSRRSDLLDVIESLRQKKLEKIELKKTVIDKEAKRREYLRKKIERNFDSEILENPITLCENKKYEFDDLTSDKIQILTERGSQREITKLVKRQIYFHNAEQKRGALIFYSDQVRKEGLLPYIRANIGLNGDHLADSIARNFESLFDNRPIEFEYKNRFQMFSESLNPYSKGTKKYKIMERLKRYAGELSKF